MASANDVTLVSEVKKNVSSYLKHEFLSKNLKFAPMREKQVDCLVEILKNVGLSNSDVVAFATSTVLVQVALDTHDFVSANNSGDALLDRQLKILGGDLASGYYYKILSDINNASLAVKLAEGIKEINILKLKKLSADAVDLTSINYELDIILISKIIENYENFDANIEILKKYF